MGVILAKFRKQKTTYQILEKLEEDIKEAEALTISTREKQRRFIVNVYLVSIGLFILGCLLYFFYFLPPTWIEKIIYSTPLFVMLILVFCIRRLGTWFFQKRLNNNAAKLTDLLAEKKKIIEKVMDTETYKVAIEILKRFGDKNNGVKPQPNTGGKKSLKPRASRIIPLNTPQTFPANILQNQTPSPSIIKNRNITQQSQSPQIPLEKQTTQTITPKSPLSSKNPNRSYVSPYNSTTSNNQLQYRTQIKTPFPIINQNEKNVVDKLLDFLIGDGQASQYGMICKECYGHNGMVSLEDYEYSAFRCAFCKVLNPAKKIRPIAPALSVESVNATMSSRETISSSSTSSSDKESGSENEEKSTHGIAQPTTSITSITSTEISQDHPSTTNVQAEATKNDDMKSQLIEEEINENMENKSLIDKKTD